MGLRGDVGAISGCSEALHVLASMAKPTAVSRNTAISACRWMQALQIFASAEQVNKITFNSRFAP